MAEASLRYEPEVPGNVSLDLLPVGVVVLESDGRTVWQNPVAKDLLKQMAGCLPERFRMLPAADTRSALPAGDSEPRQPATTAVSPCEVELRFARADGTEGVLRGRSTSMPGDRVLVALVPGPLQLDARERTEMERALTLEVLDILNRTEDPDSAARRILAATRKALHVEAGAIRLAREGDYTYAATEGFSKDFVAAENCLLARDPAGRPVLDAHGRPEFECTCGLVLMGRTDPSNPIFTPSGCVCVNDSSLPGSPDVEDTRFHPRNRCVHSGYRSVTLIPIRAGKKILGLLQLNDHRPNCFPPDLVGFLERIASTIGIALERKLNRDRLAHSLERLHYAHTATKSGFWSWDLRTKAVEWSDSFYSLIGRKPHEVEPSAPAWMESIHPDDRPRVEHAIATARLTRGDSEIEWRTVWPDGTTRWLMSRSHVEKDAQGNALRYTGIALDVTEQKHTAAVLRESETRFQELFECSPVALCVEDFSAVGERFGELRAQGVVDLQTYLDSHPEEIEALAARVPVLAANEAGLKLLGAPSTAELSTDLRSYFDETSLPVFRDTLVALFDGKTKFEAETILRELRHKRLDVHLRMSVLPSESDSLSKVLVSLTDLTARKAADAERRQLERELNHLQRLDSLGRLAGGVSHDMNNVLGAIMAIGSLLKARHSGDPVVKKDAETLVQAAARGRDLVKALRDFSRKELQSATELDLNEIVRQETELLERTSLKRVTIALDLEPRLPPVFGEASSIQNALMNLCVNAIDAMSGMGELKLSTRSLGDGFVELTVADNGEGMPPEVLARALEPFFTTKPIGKGTGLGLSQVYGTVKAHGGRVAIESNVGVGTRVSMSLPSQRHLAAACEKSLEEETIPNRSLSILLVDDEALIRGTVQDLLIHLGHRVQSASSGAEALRRLESGGRADLVMLDMNMPDMDGLEVLSKLRSRAPTLPVLFATGYADERFPSVLKQLSAVRILHKPFTLNELGQVLSTWPPVIRADADGTGPGTRSSPPAPPGSRGSGDR
jgi:PAS domain S-box-containing protein